MMKNSSIIMTTFAVALMVAASAGIAVFAIGNDNSEAAITDDTYGTATEITIAPGMTYTWTSEWPSDLSPTLTVAVQAQDSLDGTTVSIASLSDYTLTVAIPSDAAEGTAYHVVLMATTTDPAQTCYVYIVFNVVANLTASVSASNVVVGASVDITPSASGMGTVTWTADSDMPSWLSIDSSTGEITGTAPSTAATVSFTITATSSYNETATVTVSFSVVSELAPTNAPENGIIIMPASV